MGVALFVVICAGCRARVSTASTGNPAGPLIAGALIGLYLLFAIKVADQWERVAVLRFGQYIGLRGPGMFHMIPIVDTLSRYVDQRVRVANVTAESTLTRDTVPVNVDAIVFWLVWNAEKSILEVQDFTQAIMLSAQTALRESIGRHELAPDGDGARTAGPASCSGFWTRRRIRGASRCNRWRSATCRSRRRWRTRCRGRRRRSASGRRASFWARRRRRSPKSSRRPSLVYQNNPTALHLRAMNMLYEAIKEKGSMVIVPSSAVETMGLGGMLATPPRWPAPKAAQ